ncbi:MAG: hypothetical protein MZV49_05255 [Rhodopseudomonas palustris]|nr:hypothetical protein [Rhodopseudomonas palustris]
MSSFIWRSNTPVTGTPSYGAIKTKEAVNEDEIMASLAKLTSPVLTIIDEDYPERLKKIYKPPFVAFLPRQQKSIIR